MRLGLNWGNGRKKKKKATGGEGRAFITLITDLGNHNQGSGRRTTNGKFGNYSGSEREGTKKKRGEGKKKKTSAHSDANGTLSSLADGPTTYLPCNEASCPASDRPVPEAKKLEEL